ncbi:MAG: hypothetical protein U0798_05865 [Gemmataceae bacterium]
MPRDDFDSDNDEDDIAYISDEDDSRGPGCLAVMALLVGGMGLLGCLVVLAWLISEGAFSDPDALTQPNSLFIKSFIAMAGGLSFLAGAFGLGFGLYAEKNLQLSGNPGATKVLARSGSILGGIAFLGILTQILILVVVAKR